MDNSFGKFTAPTTQKTMVNRARKRESSWFEISTKNEVKRYFIANDFAKEKGEVFYYCFRLKSWCWESGEHISAWKAAADKWMRNLEN